LRRKERFVSIPRRCLAFTLAVLLSAPALADDWPQWGGSDPGRNMVSSETGLPGTFEPGKKTPTGVAPGSAENVRWAARLGSHIYGNVTVADGKVFVGTDDALLAGDDRLERTQAGMVKCLDEKTGRLLWQLVTPKRTNQQLPPGAHYGQQHCGTCSSPAWADGRVYVVTSACEMVCLDADGLADGNDGPFKDEGRYMAPRGKKPVELIDTDADILWVYDMVRELNSCPHDVASCSALVVDGFVYTSTSNGLDGAHKKCIRPDAPSLVVLDAETGRLVAMDNEKIGHRMYHCTWAPPSMGVVNGKKLIFFGGGDGVCYAFEALTEARDKPLPLKKVWSYDCNPPEYTFFEDGKPIPYYRGDKRKKYSTNKNDGKYVGPSQIISTPVFHGGRVYATIGQDPAHGRGRGMLHCIDPTGTGDITESGRIWANDDVERTMASVAVADGLLYVVDFAGRLQCLDPDTGKRIWLRELKSETWATPLVADGKVFVGTKRHLHILTAGRDPKELAKIRLGAPSYATPVAANRTVFIASQKYLWAVEKGATVQK
jgi:outer membrane protein assembly factor BamB